MTRKCGDFCADLGKRYALNPSWPGLSRPSTFLPSGKVSVDARVKPGHDVTLPAGGLVARVRRRGGRREPGFQRGDAQLQRLVFLARQPRHVLDRLEFLALDVIEV